VPVVQTFSIQLDQNNKTSKKTSACGAKDDRFDFNSLINFNYHQFHWAICPSKMIRPLFSD